MGISIRASIVIITYNRAPYLRRLLAELQHLQNAEFEVIVVSAPSTDETPSVLEEYNGYIKVVEDKEISISVGRNLGLEAASGDIVVFIDDDVLPTRRDWLEQYIQAFQEHQEAGYAWSAVRSGDTDWYQYKDGATSEYGFQANGLTQIPPLAPDGKPWTPSGFGGNVAFHREKAISLGGFDENYIIFKEETDLCLRSARAGYQGVYLPDNEVRHYWGLSARRLNKYDRDWDLIAKSETYFALKTASDPLPLRLWKTLRYANRKRFVQDIDSFWKSREISFSHWLRLRGKSLKGLLGGLWIGLTRSRTLRDFHSPSPFLPFPTMDKKGAMQIALITTSLPDRNGFESIKASALKLARKLHEHGHEVHLLALSNSSFYYQSLPFTIYGVSPNESVEQKLQELYHRGIKFDLVHQIDSEIKPPVVIDRAQQEISPLRVSIIINTFNRAPYLQQLLAGLSHLRNAQFEVIVVNGPSTDETTHILKQYDGFIKVVSYAGRNLSESRNLGIAEAAGDIIVFIDDDALPAETTWLKEYIRAFQDDPQIGSIWGPVLHRDTSWFEFHGGATSDYGFQSFLETPLSQRAPDGSLWTPRGPGGNIAFNRENLVKVGGFDKVYSYYMDETDVCLRMSKAGFLSVFLPSNSIRHYSAVSERRLTQYDRNWDVITKSDTYFALKNSEDKFFVRLVKTLRFANKKHFVEEIDAYRANRAITTSHWMRLRWKWLRGLVSGFLIGIFQPRRFENFKSPPPPFLPFKVNTTKKPLRIALITATHPGQPGFGGVGRYTYDLARGLHQLGHEVHLLCRDEAPIHYESLGFVIHGITSAEVASVYINEEDRPILNKNLAFSIAVERKLRNLYQQGIEFDVVHATNWDLEPIALIREQAYPLALMLVTPLAQVIRTEGWDHNKDLLACVELDRWQIQQADVVCIPSRGVLKSYEALMDLHPKQLKSLEVTPLGIIPDLKADISERKEDRRRKLLFVGRLERRKGIHTLLEVLPDLMQQFPEWECHIVGNDSIQSDGITTFREQFQEIHRHTPWLKRVFFHGTVSQQTLLDHYRTCDLFVAPSLFESFGLIYQEAMQFGKPVVGCRTGGIPEVVEDGVEGFLVKPDNSKELGEALSNLMRNDELRVRMGSAARERIHQRDNYLAMASRLELVYRTIIQEKGKNYCKRRRTRWKSS